MLVQLHNLHARFLGEARILAEYGAGSVPLPGSPKPTTSVRQFMELAVNMPEHEPQVGQTSFSILAEGLFTVQVARYIRADRLKRGIQILPLQGKHRPA